jgi:hypothetical protein
VWLREVLFLSYFSSENSSEAECDDLQTLEMVQLIKLILVVVQVAFGRAYLVPLLNKYYAVMPSLIWYCY